MMNKTAKELTKAHLDEARLFNDYSTKITSASDTLQQSARDFFIYLKDISILANTFPNVVGHRKLNLQRLINATLSSIESINQELKNTNFECKSYEASAKRQADREKSENEYRERLQAAAATNAQNLRRNYEE